MTGITKRFGSVTALDKVDLTVQQGSIHAVVGENGAGKTTLMRILYGALSPDQGETEINGRAAAFHSSSQAIDAGIGMVSQHYGIIPALTALENLILGAEGGPVVNVRDAAAKAQSLAQKMGFSFQWHREASELSPAGAQKLEILKLLWRNARIMILDEPTAMLSPADSDALFRSLRQLVSEGATVILVTHRLPEVLQQCSRVTVLRGGRLVADKEVSGTSGPELAQLIVGGQLAVHEPGPARDPGEPILSVEDIVVQGDRGHHALKDVNLEVRAGEIVGIAGVDGSGQRELFRSLIGIQKPLSGEIRISGKTATKSPPRERIASGVRLIPEDRHDEGVVEEWSLEHNAILGLQRLPDFSQGGRIDVAARRDWAARVAEKFSTRHGGLELPMSSLSGGNQQRFVAARALEHEPKLILAFQPARGLDLGATADVYRAIREKCDSGAAALVVSFDLDELLEHCDRILVMNNGQMFEPGKEAEKDRDAIGRLMVGAA